MQWEEFLRGQSDTIWERVRGLDDVLTDPQNLANDYIVEIDLPVSGKTKTVGTLMAFSETPTDKPKPAPTLGEHTRAILRDLEFTDAEIDSVNTDAESTRRGQPGAMAFQVIRGCPICLILTKANRNQEFGLRVFQAIRVRKL